MQEGMALKMTGKICYVHVSMVECNETYNNLT